MQLREHTTQISNVLVIGSGGSGLRAAITAKQAGLAVTVLGKRSRGDVHTVLAAGGINAALANLDPDSWQQHFADTYLEGYGIAEPRVVELMAKESPDLVREIDGWGANFAKLENGKIDQRFFGAHTYRRTCYSGDYTGRSILLALLSKADELKIPIHDSQYVTELLIRDRTCFGAMSFNIHSGKRTVHLADAVVLAAGGHTRIWRKSSSRRNENTGDGFYLGLKAGCELTDMEMVQFHPTGMVLPEEIAGTLVTEAVRGEGGLLINGNGDRFMKNYDPERQELSTRDRVAIANYTEIMEGRGTANGGVYLDISHRDKDFILEKLPRIYRQFLDAQMVDISKEPMEVAPTSHYSMGGLVVSPDEHWTGVEGLYAAGEVTGGLHGANRLGGNSLAEILIFGKRAGLAAGDHSKHLGAQVRSQDAIQAAHNKIDSFIKKGDEMARPLQHELRNIMWEHCGVVRDQEKLNEGLAKLAALKETTKDLDVRLDSEGCEDLVHAFDLEASIMCAEATILSALERRESRGAHQRSDFPEISPSEKVNYRINLGDDATLAVSRRVIEPLREELQKIVDGTAEINSFEGKLLE
ncbi:MAG: FAD-dependent oxidoreductase [Cyanobacteria bacterium P01_C01_bin.89]